MEMQMRTRAPCLVKWNPRTTYALGALAAAGGCLCVGHDCFVCSCWDRYRRRVVDRTEGRAFVTSRVDGRMQVSVCLLYRVDGRGRWRGSYVVNVGCVPLSAGSTDVTEGGLFRARLRLLRAGLNASPSESSIFWVVIG